jgi:hypothetical protein
VKNAFLFVYLYIKPHKYFVIIKCGIFSDSLPAVLSIIELKKLRGDKLLYFLSFETYKT